jgi:thiosulfate/3-mercaptopyruvate sulfurtransferase
MGPLISAAELHDLRGAVRLLDVRWRLDRPDGRPAYREGHLPGAVYVDLDAELADHARPAVEGRHPLPTAAAFQESARRWGLDDGDRVVVYDDLGGMSAARAWWMLRDAGVEVALLDGGLAAWTAAGYPLETGEATPQPGSITVVGGRMPVLDADETAAFDGVLLDARAAERYRGEIEPVDPRAGHIPGAVSAPTADNLGPDGRFLTAERLRERFTGLGVDPARAVAAYCGSGVTAAHEALALTLAGFEPAIFPGSWSAWSNDLGRPVATGS